MKSTILSLGLILLLFTAVQAQEPTNQMKKGGAWAESFQKENKLRLSIGLDQGIPVGYVSKYSGYVLGGGLQAEYLALKELGINLSGNFLHFMGKDGESGVSFIPVMGGLNFYLSPKIYLSAQAGCAFYAGKEDSEKSTYLCYAPGIGYRLSDRLSLLGKYQGVNIGVNRDYSFAGLHIAYRLNGNTAVAKKATSAGKAK